MSLERSREIEVEADDLGSLQEDLDGPCWRRTSSGSSLSTITPDACPYEEEKKDRNGDNPSLGNGKGHIHLHQAARHLNLTYASLQRPVGNGPNKTNGSSMTSLKNQANTSKNRLSSPTMHPRHGTCFRGSSSATASPIINGRYNNGGADQYNSRHLMQPQQQWFQHPLERAMEAVKKELGSVTQETRRLDMDVNCLRQDVDSVQESNAAVRATLENTRERAGRLSLQITNAERQITSAVKVRPECL